MQILVSVVLVNGGVVNPSPPGPGHRFFFTENLVLQRYDNNTPGNGLPHDPQNRLAGSHSGFVTTVRIARAGDQLYPQGSYLFQYEATFRFNTVPNTPLLRGQVTARGLIHGNYDNLGNLSPLDGPIRLAITGGTEAYVTARGQITERQPNLDNRLLDIQP
jgi:hypothetical protein